MALASASALSLLTFPLSSLPPLHWDTSRFWKQPEVSSFRSFSRSRSNSIRQHQHSYNVWPSRIWGRGRVRETLFCERWRRKINSYSRVKEDLTEESILIFKTKCWARSVCNMQGSTVRLWVAIRRPGMDLYQSLLLGLLGKLPLQVNRLFPICYT